MDLNFPISRILLWFVRKGKVSLYGKQLTHYLELNKNDCQLDVTSCVCLSIIFRQNSIIPVKEFGYALGKCYCKHKIQMAGVTDTY